jgi:hypothetical protein
LAVRPGASEVTDRTGRLPRHLARGMLVSSARDPVIAPSSAGVPVVGASTGWAVKGGDEAMEPRSMNCPHIPLTDMRQKELRQFIDSILSFDRGRTTVGFPSVM